MPNMNKKKKEIRNYDKEKNQIMSAYVFDLAWLFLSTNFLVGLRGRIGGLKLLWEFGPVSCEYF